MKQIRCGDVGYFPKCETTVRGETEDEVIAAIFGHAMDTHKWPTKLRMLLGRQRFVEQATARARASIREV
jgi:predicted small metal-binding protein